VGDWNDGRIGRWLVCSWQPLREHWELQAISNVLSGVIMGFMNGGITGGVLLILLNETKRIAATEVKGLTGI
jgi:hypothetical protein